MSLSSAAPSTTPSTTPLRGPGAPARAGTTDGPATAAPLPSDQLLQGRKAIEISHNGSVYRLQATKLGKLILTK